MLLPVLRCELTPVELNIVLECAVQRERENRSNEQSKDNQEIAEGVVCHLGGSGRCIQ